MIVCDIIGFKRDSVLTNKLAKNKLFKGKIKVIGKKPKIKYQPPSEHIAATKLFKLVNILIPQSKITVDTKACIKCHSCEKRCPVKAIKLQPYPVIDKKKCIRCFCCIEVCPTHALYLKEHFLRKLAAALRRRFIKI